MKRIILTTTALLRALALCASGGGSDTQPAPQEIPENVRITFIMQEYYEGDDIVEIPHFEYDGAKNDVIDGINRLFNQGLRMRYEEFNANRSSYETMEIRTYPFTDERYAQVVVTSIKYSLYPDFRWSGTVESVNYDKFKINWIQFSDLGMKEDEILAEVRKFYMLENENAVIDSVKVTGFLLRLRGGETDYFTEILLEITANSGVHPSFYSYCPDTGEFYLFDPSAFLPFNHADMDHMEPPLYYDLFGLRSAAL